MERLFPEQVFRTANYHLQPVPYFLGYLPNQAPIRLQGGCVPNMGIEYELCFPMGPMLLR